jgi:hypothetical protein
LPLLLLPFLKRARLAALLSMPLLLLLPMLLP